MTKFDLPSGLGRAAEEEEAKTKEVMRARKRVVTGMDIFMLRDSVRIP